MTNLEKYSRLRDIACFVVAVLLSSTGFYLLGETRGRAKANELCDAKRAERIEKQIKGVPQGTFQIIPQPRGTKT